MELWKQFKVFSRLGLDWFDKTVQFTAAKPGKFKFMTQKQKIQQTVNGSYTINESVKDLQ